MKKTLLAIAIAGLALAPSARAINIIVDYTYDTNNFFDTAMKKAAMQAAADRFSTVIDTSLLAVSPDTWRVGFTHPGTGASYQLSTAANVGADPLSGTSTADVYGFTGLTTDNWILYAGGRSLGSAGVGGTATGLNFTSTFDDISGPMHRGISDNEFGGGSTSADLPRWGGAISFDNDGGTVWHFDLATTAPFGTTDFYSIALHEIGHALGLSTSWNQWQDNGAGLYLGATAIAAYNTDNATSLTSLDLVSAGNNHWEDGTYESFIFPHGSPNTVGTVPGGTLQDLLMEPTANFGGLQDRFELTNTDVAALEDLGWSIIPEPSRALLFAFGLGAILFRRRR